MDISKTEMFAKVTDPSSLLSIVEKRLPHSCFCFNQLKAYDKFHDDLEVFQFDMGGEAGEGTWILTKFYREDWELMISVSAPNGDIPEMVKEAFLKSGVIEWDKPFIFTALQPHVYQLVLNINIETFGNIVRIYPCYLFHMKLQDALDLDLDAHKNESIEVKPLEVENGSQFILSGWKYSNEKTSTFVQKSIQRLVSGGVYLKQDVNDNINDKDSQLVCGAITPGFGLVSMLATEPEHRRKGYASICMKYIFKELARQGFQPCLASEIVNKSAVNFHRSLGLTAVAQANFISHKLDI